MSRYLVAAAQYPVDSFRDWAGYEEKLERWVTDAANAGAQLAVFPEYGAMELASLEPETMGDLHASIHFVNSLLPRIDALHRELASRHNIYILAASAPCLTSGRFCNRARLFAPDGKVGFQDKLIMTRFEREQWSIAGGDRIALFDTKLGRIGICICYDVEFPLAARALIEAGAEILLVPSCTDTRQGHERVRIGAQARALEGQCYVVQSSTVGEAPWSPAIDVNRGRAGIFGPPDKGFPEDGVVAQGEMDKSGWIFARIDTALVEQVRQQGSVLNAMHWKEQHGESFSSPIVQDLLAQGLP